MPGNKVTRLSKIARELNVGISTIVEFLHDKGSVIDSNPNTKVTPEQFELLLEEYSTDLNAKKESEKVSLKHLKEKQESVSINDIREVKEKDVQEDQDEVFIKDSSSASVPYETEKVVEKEQNISLNIIGKIDVEKQEKPKVLEEESAEKVLPCLLYTSPSPRD